MDRLFLSVLVRRISLRAFLQGSRGRLAVGVGGVLGECVDLGGRCFIKKQKVEEWTGFFFRFWFGAFLFGLFFQVLGVGWYSVSGRISRMDR